MTYAADDYASIARSLESLTEGRPTDTGKFAIWFNSPLGEGTWVDYIGPQLFLGVAKELARVSTFNTVADAEVALHASRDWAFEGSRAFYSVHPWWGTLAAPLDDG